MEADTLAIIGSWLTIMIALLWQSNRHEDSIKALDTKFTEKFEDSDNKLTALSETSKELSESSREQGRLLGEVRDRLSRVEEHMEDHGRRLGELEESSKERGRVLVQMRERLARVEGYLMPPGGFSLPQRSQPGEDNAPADDPGTEHHHQREAG